MQKFTGKQMLHIAVANAFGLDKESWDARLKWFERNEPYLEKGVDAADDKMLYLKAVHALREVQAGEPTGFIMSLDATASGYQLMAVLSGCEVAAKAVNLIDTGKREDLYSKVSAKMNTYPAVNVTRAMVKHPIMTTGYGSKAQPKQLFGEDTPELDAFYNILYSELPGPMRLMVSMQACWDPTVMEHSWTMPDGHRVIAKVTETVNKKIEVDEFEHATFTYRAKVNQPNEFGLSLAANIIHSVDGYVVREVIRRADKEGFQVATIHDSFWSHPNDMQRVRELFVEILAEIADSNLMQDILQEITGTKRKLNKASKHLGLKILQSNYALS